MEVVKSGRWGGNYTGEPGFKADELAAPFADHHGARYGIAAMNGTVTLEVALRAAGVGPGDNVVHTVSANCRALKFIAQAFEEE